MAWSHPALRHLVRRYIGYRRHGVTLVRHRGLLSGSITLVISFAEPIRIVDGVGGLHLGPTLIEEDRYQHGLHVELNPLGIRALLGVTRPN